MLGKCWERLLRRENYLRPGHSASETRFFYLSQYLEAGKVTARPRGNDEYERGLATYRMLSSLIKVLRDGNTSATGLSFFNQCREPLQIVIGPFMDPFSDGRAEVSICLCISKLFHDGNFKHFLRLPL